MRIAFACACAFCFLRGFKPSKVQISELPEGVIGDQNIKKLRFSLAILEKGHKK